MVDRVRRVDFGSQTFVQDVHEALRDDGVVVIQDVFTDHECNATIRGIAESIRALNPAVAANGTNAGWTEEHLPAGPRLGMMQSLVSNLPCVWAIRTHPHFRRIFEAAYRGFRPADVDVRELFSSIDGLTMRPPVAPFDDGTAKDWAHVDQMRSADPFVCIQGQAVLTDCTQEYSPAFRCSIGSHRVFSDLVAFEGRTVPAPKGDWHMFKASSYREMARHLPNGSDDFQVPIHTPKGSVILWTSATVHSAKLQARLPKERQEVPADGPWTDWRCVVYVCMRPRADVENPHEHSRQLHTCFHQNRVTNHWGSKVFQKKRGRSARVQCPTIRRVQENPELVYQIVGKPPLDGALQALLDGTRPDGNDDDDAQVAE
eukprot:m.40874 g.40874  ORF g.40874 m.40874 type:complete len:373 (+) comp10479_c1_seq1:307-1425(+)